MPNLSSKLEPHRDFIASERKKKTTYRRIAELLAERGVTVDYSTIHAFVKVRSKRPRKVITMWEPPQQEESEPAHFPTAVAGMPRQDAVSHVPAERCGQLDAIRRLKNAKPDKRPPEKGLPSFEEGAPLERLSDDEARRLRGKL